jgi:tRNA pseudouridine38-40 synthase
MRFLKLHISYDGEGFYGMQRQNSLDNITIQSCIEESFTKFYKESINIHYAGRTDRYVHAKEQFILFKDNNKIPFSKLKDVLQRTLSNYPININHIEEVSDKFHPRKDAIRRDYEYWFYTGNKNLFLSKYMLRVNNFDIDKLNSYSECLLGKKDFKLFCKSSKDYNNTIRDIMVAHFKKTKFSIIGYSGDSFVFLISANGFMYNMVRIIVGLLLHALYNNWAIDYFKNVINSENKIFWKIVPGNSLFLKKIYYN